MFANCCNTCLSQNCRAGSFQVSVSSICETRTAPTKICQVRRNTKHIKTCLLCISKLTSAEKTCKKWLTHLQKSSNHPTSMEVLSVLSILSILRPSWSCLSSLFRLLNNSRERSNHKQSQVFFCGQYCLLSTVVICCDLLCNARFCRWPSKVLPLWSLGQDVRALGCLGNTGMKRTKMKYHEMTWKIVR